MSSVNNSDRQQDTNSPTSQRRPETRALLSGAKKHDDAIMDDSVVAMEPRFSLTSLGADDEAKYLFGDIRMISIRKNLVECFKAAAVGDLQSLRSFLSEDNSNTNTLDERGMAALHYAARYNQVEATALLLDFGANVNIRAMDGSTPLHQAARYNAREVVEKLLNRQADVTLKLHTTGATALHIAVDFGHDEIAERLLADKQCRIDAEDSQGATPLHLACLRGHEPVCELLLRNGANIEVQTAAGSNVLHFAASSADSKIVTLVLMSASQVLLKASDLNQKDEKFKWFVDMRDGEMKTPLHVAMQTGDLHVTEVLLEHGADINAKKKNLQTPVHLAACGGKPELLSAVISKGGEVNTKDEQQRTPLHSAVLFGNKDTASLLIDNGAELDVKDRDGLTPFLCAVRSGQNECVKLLLEAGADTSARDKRMLNCLHLAVKKEHEQVLKLLLIDGGTKLMNQPDDEDKTPLHYAALATNVKILESLLVHPGNCFTKDATQKTPLHLAAEMGKERHVEVLAKASLSCLFLLDNFNRTPLHSAIIHRKRWVVAVLIGLGCDLTSPDIHGWTPLMWSAISGSVEIAKMLLEQRVSPDDMDQDGNTALHLACQHGNVDLVNLLLGSKAAIPMNCCGQTCLDVAMEKNHSDVVMTIVKHQRWQEFVSVVGPGGKRPIEKLIQHYPEAAAIVMDHCVQRSHPDSRDASITYDFRLLDPGPEVENSGAKRFSGMSTMVQYNRQDLLGHALSRKLLRVKWSTFGRYVFWGNFGLYVAFVAFLTIFLLSERKEIELDNPRKANRPIKNKKFFKQKNNFNSAITWFVLGFVIGHMVKEIYQIVVQRWKYFRDPVNFLEWALYITTFCFMLPYMAPPGEEAFRNTAEVYWHVGTICVFLGYVDAILFLQTIGFLGLYITMFIEITKTVMKAMIVLILFILAFALVFFILLKEQDSFEDFNLALMRVTVMAIGEFDYVPTLVDSLEQLSPETNAPLVPYPELTYFFFFIFVLAMPIVLMNLLIGLAVGDIESIRRTAYMRKKARKIAFLVDVEKSFPLFIRRRLYKPHVVVPSSKQTHSFWRIKQELTDADLPLEKQAADLDDLRYLEMKKELRRNKQRMRNMMNSIEQIKEMLVETKSE